jgi:hypothetical protein
MSEIRYTTSARILKYLGYGLIVIGMFLLMFGVSSFFMPAPAIMDPLYMILFGVVLLFGGALLVGMAQTGIIKPEFDTVSLIKCTDVPKCKFVKAKKFEKDDYVFKDVEGKCDKCGGSLHIAAIFQMEKKSQSQKSPEEKKDEMQELPSLPKDEHTVG